MRYQIGEFIIDSSAKWIQRDGVLQDVPRRVVDCICILIERRDQALSRDVLIRDVWSRDDVSDNQLAHAVAAARKLMGDDGQAQRLIRTIPGFGYHWVGEAIEVVLPEIPPMQSLSTNTIANSEPTPNEPHFPIIELDALPMPELPQSAPAKVRSSPTLRYTRNALLACTAALATSVFLIAILVRILHAPKQLQQDVEITAQLNAPAQTASNPVEELLLSYRQGEYEHASLELGRLGPELAAGVDAGILEAELELARGRYASAANSFGALQKRVGEDPRTQAKLKLLEANLNISSIGTFGRNHLELADEVVRLLETAPIDAPSLMARALHLRGAKETTIDAALADLTRARDLFLQLGDARGAARVEINLAIVWARQGRLVDALQLLKAACTVFADDRALQAEIQAHGTALPMELVLAEVLALRTAVPIEIALLRWQDALKSSERALKLAGVDHAERYLLLEQRVLVLTGLGKLREAASTWIEAQFWRKKAQRERASTIPIGMMLSAGQANDARQQAEAVFARAQISDDLLFDSKDGALLLWTLAARQGIANKNAKPMLPPTMSEALMATSSLTGAVAKARWFALEGQIDESSALLHTLLPDIRLIQRPNLLLLACSALVENLLAQGNVRGAQAAFNQCRGQSPTAFENDYSAALLSLLLAKADNAVLQEVKALGQVQSLAGERNWQRDAQFEMTLLSNNP